MTRAHSVPQQRPQAAIAAAMALACGLLIQSGPMDRLVAAGERISHAVASSTTAPHSDSPAAPSSSQGAFHRTTDGRLRVVNRAAGLRATYDATGLAVRPRAGGDTLHLTATSLGRTGGSSRPLPAVIPTATDETAIARRGPVIEWVHSRATGLEQGWTIPARQPGSGRLSLRLGIRGAAVAASAPTALALVPPSGPTVAYDRLVVRDARGRRLPAHFVSRSGGARIVIDDAHATYPLVVDPDLTAVAHLDPTPAAGGSSFGDAVVTKGRWMVVGEQSARLSGNPTIASGRVIVYFDTTGNGTWSKVQTLTTAGTPYVAPAFPNTTGLGTAVGLVVEPAGVTVLARLASQSAILVWTFAGDPNTVAPSASATYRQGITATQWTLPTFSGVGGFGTAFDAANDGTLVVGAPLSTGQGVTGFKSATTTGSINDTIGTVEIFRRSGGFGSSYGYVTHIDPAGAINLPANQRDAEQVFGTSVAYDPATQAIAVGAPGDDGVRTDDSIYSTWPNGSTSFNGAVDLFTPSGSNAWTQAQRITSAASPAQAKFGNSLAFAGPSDGIVVGAPAEGGGTTFNPGGAAYLFDHSGGAWSQVQRIGPNDPSTPVDDTTVNTVQAGTAVAASPDGSRIYVGAPGLVRSSASNTQGEVMVWQRASETGPTTYLTHLDGQAPSDSHGGIQENFGGVLSASASAVAVGIPGFGEHTATFTGRVSTFGVAGSTYAPTAELTPAAHSYNDTFGWSIAQDGDVMAVAQTGSYSGSGYGVGAVALYERSGSGWTLEQTMFPDAGNYTGSVGTTFDAGYGFSLALHVYRDSSGHDVGLALAIGTPGASVINPGAGGTAAAVSVNQTGNVGLWTRNGPPGTGFTHGELFEGSQEQTAANPGSTAAVEPSAHFGWSVAFTGDGSLIVGVPGAQADHGNIERYEGTKAAASTWTHQETIASPGNNLVFGSQVAADGNQVVTVSDSSDGHATVYRYTDGNATTNLASEPSIHTGVLGAYNDKSLAISGNRIAIGTPSGSSFSAPACTQDYCKEQVEIYRMVGDTAVQEAMLSSEPGDLGQDPRFGNTLDFSHGSAVTTLAVGANGYDPSTPGQAFVYVAKTKADGSATWSRAATLAPTDALPPTPLIHTGAYRTGYGSAVSNWPNNGGLQVSAPDAPTDGALTGRVYTFDAASIQPPAGPQAFVDVSLPSNVQVGASQLKTAGLLPSLLTQHSATDGSIAAAPLGSIDLSPSNTSSDAPASPLAAIPLGAIPVKSIPVKSIPLSSIPVKSIAGGWSTLLAGSPFAGLPLQSVTFGDVYDLPSVKALALGALQLAGSPLASVPLVSIALGATPVKSIDISPGGADPVTDWCAALTGAGSDPAQLGLDCAHPTAASNDAVTILSLGLEGAPLGSLPVKSIPVKSIDFSNWPMRSIALSSIGMSTAPVKSIPVKSIDVGATPVKSIPVKSIPVKSIPVKSIDLAALTLAGTPVKSIPLSAIDINSTPVKSIPVKSIDLSGVPLSSIPVKSIPVKSIPVKSIDLAALTLAGTPVKSIPLSAIDINSTPVKSIPVKSIDLSGVPLASIPVKSIPLAAVPVKSIDLASTVIAGVPVKSIPVKSIDVAATPVKSILLSALPAQELATLVDCTTFDCGSQVATLGDAWAAGSIKNDAVLGNYPDLQAALRLNDLVGSGNAITADQIRSALGNLSLADLSSFGDVTLGELSPLWPYLTLGQIQPLLGGVRLGDLADHFLDFTQAQVQDALDADTQTLSDITDWDDVTLGELDVLFSHLTFGNLGGALSGVRLGDLADAIHKPGGGTYSADDLQAAVAQSFPSLTLGDITDFDDLTLGELGHYGDATMGDLLDALSADELGRLTLDQLLLSILVPTQYPWNGLDLSTVESQALDNNPNGSPVTVAYRADAPDGLPRTVRVTVELPRGARLDPSTITGDGSAAELAPTVSGSTATWTFTDVPAGAPQSLKFAMDAPLTLGPKSIKASALLVDDDALDTDTASTTVTEALEPNDTVAGATALPDDTIVLSHVSHAGDMDVYKFDVNDPGTRVSLSLSNLDADLDMVLYAPRDGTIVPTAGRTIDPVADDGGTGLPASNQDGTATPQPSIGDDIAQPDGLGNHAVIQGSFNRGRADEQIDTGVLTKTGTYYLAVSGYNAATDTQPYALRLKRFVSHDQPACPSRTVTPGTLGTELPQSLPTGTNTVFVVNRSRMAGLYGEDKASALMDQLHSFTAWLNSQSLGEKASVLTVDADPAVRAAYNQWDASPCLPAGANGVVSEIARILNGYRSGGTALKNVVVVGSDDAVPFARVPDRTTVANETGYSSTFSDTGNALYATFATSSVQTDNPYVDRSPYAFGDRTLYIPDATIGRLVESPTEIGDQLTDFQHANGKLAVGTGLVTGYDFLSDGAQNVASQVDKTYGTVDSHLISDSWTRQDLEQAIASIKPNLLSLNAHFDHFRALPGAGNTANDESDLFTASAVRGSLSGDLAGSVVFSMGCHSGLSASDLLLGGNDSRALDFAQAVSSQGGVFVGNTGFGYGDTDTVALSEQLMGDFAQRLDGSMTVGDALLYAKNAYFSGLAQYTPYDEKVLEETTFYGLPFYQLDVPNPPAPPAPLSPIVVPDEATSLSATTTHIQPTYLGRTAGDGTTYTAAVDPATGQDDLTTVQGRPVEPRTDQEYALPSGTAAHDALVLSLTSVDHPDSDPYVFQPIVDSSGERTDVGVDTAFPTSSVQVNDGLSPDGPTFHVAATTGYFRTTDPDGTGLQRDYQSIDAETFLAPAGDDDWTPPTFSQVTGQVANGLLSISAHVMDDRGDASRVKRVYLLALQDPAAGVATTWRGLDLVRTAGSDEWTGSIPTTGRNLEFILQAVDAAGNVAVTTDKADNFADGAVAGGTIDEGGTGGGTIDPLTVGLSGPQGGAGWYTGPVTVTVNGGSRVVYELVGEKDPTGYQQPFQVTGTGLHTVRVTSGDGQTRTVTIPIDTVGPTVQLDSPAAGQLMPAAPGSLILFSCPDAGSGSRSCTATLDGSPVTSGTTVPLPPGQHTVVVTTGPDNAGNAPSQTKLTRTFTVVPAPATVGTIGVAKPKDGATTTLTVPFSGFAMLTYSGTVTWGDGATTNCAMAGSGCTVTRNGLGGGTLTATHVYPASYVDTTATVTIVDNLGQTASGTVLVNRKTTLTATAALLQLKAGGGSVLLKSGAISATLKNGSGAALSGQAITFSLPDGTTICTATTNSSGTAACPTTITFTLAMLLAGHYNATFAGKDTYHGSTASASLIG